MKNLIVTSEPNRTLLGDSETWLVIGPCCWGRSRSLPIALQNAEACRRYIEGTFCACVVPAGLLEIHDDGSYKVNGWTKEQQQRAKETTRLVAVTKQAAQRWTRETKALQKEHRKATNKIVKP